jgi:hypothetical protein
MLAARPAPIKPMLQGVPRVLAPHLPARTGLEFAKGHGGAARVFTARIVWWRYRDAGLQGIAATEPPPATRGDDADVMSPIGAAKIRFAHVGPSPSAMSRHSRRAISERAEIHRRHPAAAAPEVG